MLSIESQSSEMIIYAGGEKIKIARIFSDEASAHKPNNRSGFAEMINAINNGEIDAILVWKADRLARNMIEGGQIIHLLQNGVLKLIQTRYTRFQPNDNMLPLTIELGMSNQYSLDLSKNVKRGNKTKVANGGCCGLAPGGYENDTINKTIIPDPERFHLVRKMWDLYLTESYSLKQICDIANEDWGYTTIKRKKSGGNKLSYPPKIPG